MYALNILIVAIFIGACEEPTEAAPTVARDEEEAPPQPPWISPGVTTRNVRPEYAVEAAPHIDAAYDANDTIAVTRFVYRARMTLPEKVESRGVLNAMTGELVAETDDTRLRATFEGQGWPVAPRSTVRIRGDSGGSYVFDERGGRALAETQLSAWWSGADTARTPALWMSRARTPARSAEGTHRGALLCELFRELAGLPRSDETRCTDAPTLVRIGPWQFQKTADVTVTTERRHLRADHVEPPSRARRETSFRCLEPSAAERVVQLQNQGTTTAMLVLSDGARASLARSDTITLRGCSADISVTALRPYGGALLWPTRLSNIETVLQLRQ